MFRVAPKSGINPRGKILFASRMTDPKGFEKISTNLGFMIPPLRDSGYEVLVSQANVGIMHTDAISMIVTDPMMRKGFWDGIAVTEREAVAVMQEEIETLQPDFVAFSAYDANALSVFKIATALAQKTPTVAFVFGGYFVTINPQVARDNFTDFPSVIMVNGEAEFALPQALMAFQNAAEVQSPGVFIQRMNMLVADTFDQRISLTAEEHDSLKFYLDVQEDQLRYMMKEYDNPGVDLLTSRGCFRGCSYCAASSALRSRFVTWSADRIMQDIEDAFAWARTKIGTNRLNVGLIDDDRLRSPRIVSELLGLIEASRLRNKVKLHMQGCFSGFVDSQGNIRTELMDEMQGIVELINIGGDFWDQAGRLRNRGGVEGKITNTQIRGIIKELTKREITARLYWLLGDEETTISAVAETALFLQELYIDFAPFVKIDAPEPIFPYSGTPLRQRLEHSQEGRQSLRVAARLGSFPIYDIIMPPGQVITKIFKDLTLVCHQTGSQLDASYFLSYFYAFGREWRSRMEPAQKQIVDEAVKLIRQGVSIEQLTEFLPKINTLPTTFRFLDNIIMHYDVEELLEAYHVALRIPPYYRTRELEHAEQSKRNPLLAAFHRGDVDEWGRRIKARNKPRPNDPCPCGSGKKYKKCCSAAGDGKKRKKKKKK